jgi:hypothetical protein
MLNYACMCTAKLASFCFNEAECCLCCDSTGSFSGSCKLHLSPQSGLTVVPKEVCWVLYFAVACVRQQPTEYVAYKCIFTARAPTFGTVQPLLHGRAFWQEVVAACVCNVGRCLTPPAKWRLPIQLLETGPARLPSRAACFDTMEEEMLSSGLFYTYCLPLVVCCN